MSSALQKLRPLASRIGGRAPQLRRGYAADAHGEVKVNAWEAPTDIASWKEEHIVFAVLGAWAVGITSAMKIFGGKKEAPPAQPAA